MTFDPKSKEFLVIEKRASNLSLDQLDELCTLIGVKFEKQSPRDYALKEDYLLALHEADDNQVLDEYLKSKNF